MGRSKMWFIANLFVAVLFLSFLRGNVLAVKCYQCTLPKQTVYSGQLGNCPKTSCHGETTSTTNCFRGEWTENGHDWITLNCAIFGDKTGCKDVDGDTLTTGLKSKRCICSESLCNEADGSKFKSRGAILLTLFALINVTFS